MRFPKIATPNLLNLILLIIVFVPSGSIVGVLAKAEGRISITDAAQSIASILALGFIAYQLLETKRLEKAKLILQLNEGLADFRAVASKYEAITTLNSWAALPSDEKESLLDNISYFESIFHMYHSGILSVREIERFFGGRILRLYRNSIVKELILDGTGQLSASVQSFAELGEMVERHQIHQAKKGWFRRL